MRDGAARVRDAHDETPLDRQVRWGLVVKEGGTRHRRGEGASPPPGYRAGGLIKLLSKDTSEAICLTDKLLAVSLVGWYHPRGAWEAQDRATRETERRGRADDEHR